MRFLILFLATVLSSSYVVAAGFVSKHFEADLLRTGAIGSAMGVSSAIVVCACILWVVDAFGRNKRNKMEQEIKDKALLEVFKEEIRKDRHAGSKGI